MEGRNLVITDLITEIASAYYELLVIRSNIEIIRWKLTASVKKVYRLVKVQKEAGVTNELAVKQFESATDQPAGFPFGCTSANGRKGKQDQFSCRQGSRKTIVRDTTFFANTVPVQMRLGVPSALLQNRPDIRQAEFELQASKADVLSAKGGFLPGTEYQRKYRFPGFQNQVIVHHAGICCLWFVW
jgi:outer membrane protein TolC